MEDVNSSMTRSRQLFAASNSARESFDFGRIAALDPIDAFAEIAKSVREDGEALAVGLLVVFGEMMASRPDGVPVFLQCLESVNDLAEIQEPEFSNTLELTLSILCNPDPSWIGMLMMALERICVNSDATRNPEFSAEVVTRTAILLRRFQNVRDVKVRILVFFSACVGAFVEPDPVINYFFEFAKDEDATIACVCFDALRNCGEYEVSRPRMLAVFRRLNKGASYLAGIVDRLTRDIQLDDVVKSIFSFLVELMSYDVREEAVFFGANTTFRQCVSMISSDSGLFLPVCLMYVSIARACEDFLADGENAALSISLLSMHSSDMKVKEKYATSSLFAQLVISNSCPLVAALCERIQVSSFVEFWRSVIGDDDNVDQLIMKAFRRLVALSYVAEGALVNPQ